MATRRLALAAVLIASIVAACSSDDDRSSTTTGAPTRAAESTTTSPGPSLPAAPTRDDTGDQTPPVGTNGLHLDADGNLWIADGQGDQVIQVDVDSGAILARYPTAGGATPDDIAIDEPGRVFWTGFGSGDIGRIDPATGEHVYVADLPEAANPITFALDGRLFIGLAVLDDALYEADPRGIDGARLLSEDLGNVNGFDVAADGYLYGPRANGEVVRIDWEAGTVTDVIASGLGFPAALKEGPDGALYVLSAAPAPPTIRRVDIATGAVTEVVELDTRVVDNLAVGADGTFYVTTFDRPVVLVVPPDGEPHELPIGDAA